MTIVSREICTTSDDSEICTIVDNTSIGRCSGTSALCDVETLRWHTHVAATACSYAYDGSDRAASSFCI